MCYTHITITADLLNVCGRYRVADIDMWPISTLPVVDLVFSVADIVVADMVCS